MFAPLWAALTAFLTWAMPKIAVFFGIVIISNSVLNPIFNALKQKALDNISANAGQFLNAFELLGGFDAISIVFAAYALSLGLKAAARTAAST